MSIPDVVHDRVVDDNVALHKRIAELEKALAEAQQRNWCDVCAGTGKPTNDKPCICGGTGQAADAVGGLRKLYLEAQQARERAHIHILSAQEANAKLKAERDTLRGLLREALSRLHCAHLFIGNCPPCRELHERITAALKEGE